MARYEDAESVPNMEKETKNVEDSVKVQLVTNEQLLNHKLDMILEILSKK